MPTDTFFALKAKKRERIYNAALVEFNSAPYEEVTIQSIIKRAGIPRGSFYQYFTDKDDLAVYCMTESFSKSIDAIYEDNMDFLLNKSALVRQQKRLSEIEHEFQDKSVPFFPIRLLRSSFCEHAALYYPHFCRTLEKEGNVRPEHVKILAFYLSMIDLLYQEYAYMNHLDLTDRKTQEEVLSDVSLPLQIILDTLGPFPRPAGQEAVLIKDNCSTLQHLHLSSIRLLSADGTDVTISVPANAAWQIQGDILSIPADGEKITGTLKVRINACPPEADVSSENGRESESSFESISPGRLSFRVIKNGMRLLASECYLPQNGSVCAVSAKKLTGIGTGRDGNKVCLMEDGEFCL